MTNDIYIILIFFCIMFVNNDCLFYTCVSLLCQVSEGPIPMTHVVYIKGDELIGWTNQTILQCSSVMLFFLVSISWKLLPKSWKKVLMFHSKRRIILSTKVKRARNCLLLQWRKKQLSPKSPFKIVVQPETLLCMSKGYTPSTTVKNTE